MQAGSQFMTVSAPHGIPSLSGKAVDDRSVRHRISRKTTPWRWQRSCSFPCCAICNSRKKNPGFGGGWWWPWGSVRFLSLDPIPGGRIPESGLFRPALLRRGPDGSDQAVPQESAGGKFTGGLFPETRLSDDSPIGIVCGAA